MTHREISTLQRAKIASQLLESTLFRKNAPPHTKVPGCVPNRRNPRAAPTAGYSTENFCRDSTVCPPMLSFTDTTIVYSPSAWSLAKFKLSSPG